MLSIWGCSKESDSDSGPQQARNPVYLAENGITVKAQEWAKPGDKGMINGVEYTVVDNFSVRVIVQSGNGNLCTTRVTDMSGLFGGDINSNTFNADIRSWDVSNVTTMENMFFLSLFNRPIGDWDVSKVTNMSQMFYGAQNFNQDLSAWNVENVQNCANFSTEAPQWQEPKPVFSKCTD